MICPCCGEDKSARSFSDSGRRGRASYCKACGVWLRLLRQVFGPTRNWEANRAKVAERRRLLKAQQPPKVKLPGEKKVKQPKPPKPKPVKQVTAYVYQFRTVLADAPWPYREAA